MQDTNKNIHKIQALAKLESLIDKYLNTNAPKAEKFMYWIEDYTKFLDFEDSFSPNSLRRYKRGEIIKAHLGYNIGSEEGGLHYCVVLDNDNSLSSPVLTVVPLTSVKESKDISKLRKGEIFIGHDLKDKVLKKYEAKFIKTTSTLKILQDKVSTLLSDDNLDSEFLSELKKVSDEVVLLQRIKKEFDKMKVGSIALVGQITTISKIRIYDPKTNKDPLSKIKLSNESLDKIDNGIKELFLKN